MKIAIASDIHDNLPNLKKFLSFAKRAKTKIVLICGDLAGKESLEMLVDNFKERIFLTLGNADIREKTLEVKRERLKIFEEWGAVRIGKLKIAFCHFPAKARELALSQKYDFVFFGHSHKPGLEKIGGSYLANPGNLAGLYYKTSFALLDTKTKKLSLEILEKIK